MRKTLFFALPIAMLVVNCATVNKNLLPDYDGKKPTIKSVKIPSGIDDLLWYKDDEIYLYDDFKKNNNKAAVFSLNVTTGNIVKLGDDKKQEALNRKEELKKLVKKEDNSNVAVKAGKGLGSIVKSTVTGSRYHDGEGKGELSSVDKSATIHFDYKLESQNEKKGSKSTLNYYYSLENDEFSTEIPCGTAEGWYSLNLWHLSNNKRFLIAGSNFCDLSKAKRPAPMYSWYGWAAPNPEWSKIAIIKTKHIYLFTFKKLHITALKTPS